MPILPPFTVELSREDVKVAIEALAMAASRRESQARSLHPASTFSAKHDAAATAMRSLRARLVKMNARAFEATPAPKPTLIHLRGAA